MKTLYDDVCYDVSRTCKCESECDIIDHCHDITIANVINAIKNMKRGKSDGFDGLTSDYIINGSPTLFKYLSILFTCMIRYHFALTSYGISTIVPI